MENSNIVKLENTKNCVWWSCVIGGRKHEFYWEINTDEILVTKKRAAGLNVEWKIYPDGKVTAAKVRSTINKFIKGE